MRYLLEEDESKLKKCISIIDNYLDYRQKNKLKGVQLAYITFDFIDIQQALMSLKISGKNIEVDEYILKNLKTLDKKYVYDNHIILLENNTYKIKGEYYYASDSYLKILNRIDYYRELKNKAMNYLYPKVYDLRNIVERDGYIMIGIRGKNEYDAHLLGDFISFKPLMSVVDYNKKLLEIKYENQTQNA
jgi:hypothetical protein